MRSCLLVGGGCPPVSWSTELFCDCWWWHIRTSLSTWYNSVPACQVRLWFVLQTSFTTIHGASETANTVRSYSAFVVDRFYLFFSFWLKYILKEGILYLFLNMWRFFLDNSSFYSAAALLAMLSAVLATAIPSVRPSVCLFVCLSVTRWYPIQTNEDRIMRSSLWGSKNTRVFWY